MRPSGPKATPADVRPRLTASGAGRARSRGASKTTTPLGSGSAADVTGGDAALRAEGHAPDGAFLDL